tara:strand:- start:1095 stop:1769 length:675 start_codon:yes stop_codon:yes gene_type:complete
MISWLKGEIIQKWHLSSKKGVVLDVGGVGYEVQLLIKQLEKIDKNVQQKFWIHQINREDCTNLYGFYEINERDLFRKIISVNGIGPQIGMALLEDFEVNQLVSAIVDNDISLLTKSQGIGKRIAERLVVELKNKLQQSSDHKELIINNPITGRSNNLDKYLEEIKSILNSLGYLDSEIRDSIELIRRNEKENTLLIKSISTKERSDLMDKHLKKILIRLSQKST